jgi:hypothetical protein
MVVWACSFVVSAQVAPPDAAAKLKQFERNLANAMKLPGVASLRKTQQFVAAPNPACAIPLLKVGPGASFNSNMPVVVGDAKVGVAAREATPPAPACGEQARK